MIDLNERLFLHLAGRREDRFIEKVDRLKNILVAWLASILIAFAIFLSILKDQEREIRYYKGQAGAWRALSDVCTSGLDVCEKSCR